MRRRFSLESRDKDADKPLAIIVKGNSKYIEDPEIKPLAKRFYSEVKDILKAKGYKVKFDPGLSETRPDITAKVWVAHSKGISRLKYAPPGIVLVALETLKDDGYSEDHYRLSTNDYKHLEAIKEVK